MSYRLATDQTHHGHLRHKWFPASDKSRAFGTIDFGVGNYLYLNTPGEIDELIAELTALRADMTGEPAPSPCPECGERDGWHRANCNAPFAQVTP